MIDPTRTLRALFYTPGPRGFWGAGVPNLIGKPGTAKTSLLQEIGQICGLPTRTLILSLREPADQLGLPYIRPDGKGVGYHPPDWALWAAEQKRALIIFDEVNTASPQVQASCLRILAERVVGDLELPPGVRMATAMNAVDDAAGGHDLAPAFANRLGHWRCEGMMGVREFVAFLTNGGPREIAAEDPAKIEKQVLAEWDPHWVRARGTIAGFLNRRPDLLCKPPAAHDPAASGAWPSLRTWEQAARALAGAWLHKLDPEEQEHVVAMFVGTAVAAELFTWMASADLPDPAHVLDGKTKWTHDLERLDKTAAVLTSCAALVLSFGCEKQEARVKAFWALLKPLAKQVPDLAVPAARSLVLGRFSGGKWAADSDNVLEILNPAMQAAGMIRR